MRVENISVHIWIAFVMFLLPVFDVNLRISSFMHVFKGSWQSGGALAGANIMFLKGFWQSGGALGGANNKFHVCF